jgi:hypothetical protein
LSGSQIKATGFAGGYLLSEVLGDRIDAKLPLLFCVGAVPAMQEEIGD